MNLHRYLFPFSSLVKLKKFNVRHLVCQLRQRGYEVDLESTVVVAKGDVYILVTRSVIEYGFRVRPQNDTGRMGGGMFIHLHGHSEAKARYNNTNRSAKRVS